MAESQQSIIDQGLKLQLSKWSSLMLKINILNAPLLTLLLRTTTNHSCPALVCSEWRLQGSLHGLDQGQMSNHPHSIHTTGCCSHLEMLLPYSRIHEGQVLLLLHHHSNQTQRGCSRWLATDESLEFVHRQCQSHLLLLRCLYRSLMLNKSTTDTNKKKHGTRYRS